MKNSLFLHCPICDITTFVTTIPDIRFCSNCNKYFNKSEQDKIKTLTKDNDRLRELLKQIEEISPELLFPYELMKKDWKTAFEKAIEIAKKTKEVK